MKTAAIAISALSILMVAATLVCGFGVISPKSTLFDMAYSINFPKTLAIETILFSKITLVLILTRK